MFEIVFEGEGYRRCWRIRPWHLQSLCVDFYSMLIEHKYSDRDRKSKIVQQRNRYF